VSYHPKELAPGTPDEDWIERNIRVNAATARGYASGISFLIEQYGLDRLMTEDICVILDLYHPGMSSARTWNRRCQSILQRYQRLLRETPVAGGATA